MKIGYISHVIERQLGLLFCLFVFIFYVGLDSANAAPKSKLIGFWDDYEAESRLKINHDVWQLLLDKYLTTDHPSGINRFNYNAVSAGDRRQLELYLEMLQSMDPRQLNLQRQKAFWLNLFNAGVVLEVIKSEPEDSIKDIGTRRLLRADRFNIAMQKMSLEDIQHGILRPMYKDPRLHFAFSIGNLGSANLLAQAYTGDNLEALIEKNTRDFLSHPRGVNIIDGELILSTVFKSYKEDFGGNEYGIRQFIKKYVDQNFAERIDRSRGVSYQYSWDLNKP